MKIFECNAELVAVLKRHGFIDFTSSYDRIKGKKRFKTTLSSKLSISFDYINFKFEEGRGTCDTIGSSKITEEELRFLLWYIKSSPADRKEISGDGFSRNECREGYRIAKNELDFYLEQGILSRRVRKLRRLTEAYSNLSVI